MKFSPGRRRFVYWVAHVALLAYLLQVMAIDHWSADPTEVPGMPSSTHAAHCHGAAAGCADGATTNPTLDAKGATPVPPAPRLQKLDTQSASPAAAYIATPLQPPRAA